MSHDHKGWAARWGQVPTWFWRGAAIACLLLALGLDLAGHHGHLAFVLPCTLFALLLLAVQALPREAPRGPLALPLPLPLPAAAPTEDAAGGNAALGAETQFMPPPPPPLPGMMAVLDTEHRCSAASPALARWLDTDRDQLTGRSVAEMMGPAAAATLVPHIEAALGGNLRRVRCCHVAPDGKRRWLHVELQPRIDEYGERIGCDMLAMDVTPEHRRLERLQRSERRLRTLLDQLPVAVSYVDAEYRWRYLNTAQSEWMGLAPDAVLGKTIAELLGDTGFAALQPNLQAALQGEVVPMERYRIDDAGQPEWQAGQHLPDFGDEGEVVGVFTVFQDITARVVAEQPPRAGEEGPADTSAAPTTNGSEDAQAAAAPASGALALSVAPQPGEALLPMLNQLFDLQALAAVAQPPELLDFDLHLMVEDLVQLHAPRAHARGLALACRIDQRLPDGVRADARRLQQVLGILIGQALDRTPQGEVLVDVQRIDPGHLRLAVHDTGRGMEAPMLQRLLTDDPSVAEASGATPALLLAVRLVHMMGARLGAESSSESGSSFWITLPFDVADTVPPPSPADLLAGRHVLVVDPNATQRDILERLLLAAGMRCSLAADDRQAQAQLQQARALGDPVQLALIDLQPAEAGGHGGATADGITLASRLLSDPANSGMRPVLMMPLGAPGAMQRARDAGLRWHLCKPVRRRDLHTVLLQALAAATPAAGPAPPSVRLPVLHARVLLAEDSGVNQVVTQSMLEALGCEFSIVANGQAAVQALQREHFDIVLMDSHLPELDGLATSRAIRQREQALNSRRRLPIVALTDSALVSSVEPCHAAGMDDHLARPFSRQQLADMLARWLPAELVEHPTGAASQESRAPAAPDPRQTQAMRDFLAALPDSVKALRECVDQGRAEALVQTAMALADTGTAVGATSLANLCHQLEQMGHSGDLTGAAGRVAALEAMAECIAPAQDAEAELDGTPQRPTAF